MHGLDLLSPGLIPDSPKAPNPSPGVLAKQWHAWFLVLRLPGPYPTSLTQRETVSRFIALNCKVLNINLSHSYLRQRSMLSKQQLDVSSTESQPVDSDWTRTSGQSHCDHQWSGMGQALHTQTHLLASLRGIGATHNTKSHTRT